MDRFSRSTALLGEAAAARLARARVAVVGIGGVGGYAVEALARTGIGALDLFDGDTVAPTNINRQIIATDTSVGRPKVEVAAERVRDIHPACTVRAHHRYLRPTDSLDLSVYDYVIDAIDSVPDKLFLIEATQRAGVPIISCMGTGNKLDPLALRVADIGKTEGCPLARAVRVGLRRRGVRRLRVVYSPERPHGGVEEEGHRVPSSCIFVPATAGLLLAREVVLDLTRDVCDVEA